MGAAACGCFAACGGSAATDTHPPGSTASSVIVTPSPMLVAVGGSAQIAARAVDASMATIPGATPAFQSSDPGTASINASGLVTGLRAGTVTISATYGGATGTTKATVVAPTSIAGRVSAI